MANAGNSLLLIQKALNHKSYEATRAFARMAEDPVRQAMGEHGKRLMRVAKGEKGADVIELRSRS